MEHAVFRILLGIQGWRRSKQCGVTLRVVFVLAKDSCQFIPGKFEPRTFRNHIAKRMQIYASKTFGPSIL